MSVAAPRIAVHGFERRPVIRMIPDPANPGKKIEDVREEDWVTYGPVGLRDRSSTSDRVSRLSCLPANVDMKNPAVRMAAMRWAAIEPQYLAWKAGTEAPVDGTPLAILNSIPQVQADFLRSKGVKTIEELSVLTDTHIERLKLSGLRTYIAEAKRWLAASDARKVSATLAEKDKEIASLEQSRIEQADQIAALMRKMDELAGMVVEARAATDGDEPAKRGPGRPRKEAEAA